METQYCVWRNGLALSAAAPVIACAEIKNGDVSFVSAERNEREMILDHIGAS